MMRWGALCNLAKADNALVTKRISCRAIHDASGEISVPNQSDLSSGRNDTEFGRLPIDSKGTIELAIDQSKSGQNAEVVLGSAR